MAKRQRKWARRAYEKLILQLGGRCIECGSLSGLSIDHINGKDWTAYKVEWSHRISIYRREASQGLLQILCIKCNSRKGRPAPPPFDDGCDDQYTLFTISDADESDMPPRAPHEPSEDAPF
jgi:5-methylcytosine-specific restriction endonuclease McrA